MEEREKLERSADHKTLEFLFDYTKFHIQAYITLTGSYIAAAAIKLGDKTLLNVNQRFLWPSVIFIAFAGMAGGYIVSSITRTAARSGRQFLESPTDFKWLTFGNVATIEHRCFWLGLILAACSFYFRPGDLQGSAQLEHSARPVIGEVSCVTGPCVCESCNFGAAGIGGQGQTDTQRVDPKKADSGEPRRNP